ncbi:hypothetical protein [Novosphingobium resinovorum]|uniref:hypothetical protein n=1 Tax=Novosphingobium resinovorum TaxID=158500 RepID=UPI003D28462E
MIIDKVKASTADLPAPRKYADLKSAEKDKLAGLLGISRKELDDGEAKKAAE